MKEYWSKWAKVVGSFVIRYLTAALLGAAGAWFGPDAFAGERSAAPVPANLECIKAVDVLRESRWAGPDYTFKSDVLFRYDEARYFAKTAGWEPNAKTFYYVMRSDGRFMIIGADKNNCLLNLGGAKARWDPKHKQTFVGMVPGEGLDALMYIQQYVKREARNAPTV